MNEVLLNKKVGIERCISQIRRYYESRGDSPFETDYLRQDAICMNLQRACELTIDIANHIIKKKKLGLPQESKDCFALLQRAGLISLEQMKSLQGMVGFRNILVHEYQRIDLNILVEVIEQRLGDLLNFANDALKTAE